MLLSLIVIVACCIIFAAPIGVSLIIVGLIFWAGAGYDVKFGCLGRIIDLLLLLIGTVLIIVGFCLM